MAPDIPINLRPSLKRKLSERDEIIQKWRTDRHFKADGDYRDKCQTIYADAEEVIMPTTEHSDVQHSHQSKIPEHNVNKKFKASSCANDALKLIIQECIGRIDKIDSDFEKYKKSRTFEKTPEMGEKPYCKCTCSPKENSSKTKERLENIAITSESVKGIMNTLSKHSSIIEVTSENYSSSESATVPTALPNVSSQMSLDEIDTCQTSRSTDSSPKNVSDKPSHTFKTERIEKSPTKYDLPCNSPTTKEDFSCSLPATEDDFSCNMSPTESYLSCNTSATEYNLSCNMPTTEDVVSCNTPATKESLLCNTPATKDIFSCNTPSFKDDLPRNMSATKDDLTCNTPISKDDVSCNTPATKDDMSCNMSINTPATNDDLSCSMPATKNDLSCNTSATKDDVSCNTPGTEDDLPVDTLATKDDLSCNTPATKKIKPHTRSKLKEFWFEANIHDFENKSPNVQRGRPSIHVLKDRRIVQSLAKQFS